jgi:hypothetical protein
MFSFGSAILVFALFSALILWLAVSRCLPAERMEAHLSDPASGTPAQSASAG